MEISQTQKQTHTLANCVACYRKYQDLQESFPGKPIFLPPLPIIQLPETAAASCKKENDLARRVLSELNSAWEGKFTHFLPHYPKIFPKPSCVQKIKSWKKREDQTQKLVQHITKQLKENITMSVLVGKSLSSYNWKLLAPFEPPPQAKKK